MVKRKKAQAAVCDIASEPENVNPNILKENVKRVAIDKVHASASNDASKETAKKISILKPLKPVRPALLPSTYYLKQILANAEEEEIYTAPLAYAFDHYCFVYKLISKLVTKPEHFELLRDLTEILINPSVDMKAMWGLRNTAMAIPSKLAVILANDLSPFIDEL